jgi:hypothetical protein
VVKKSGNPMSGKPTVATVPPQCFKVGSLEQFSLLDGVCGRDEPDFAPALWIWMKVVWAGTIELTLAVARFFLRGFLLVVSA